MRTPSALAWSPNRTDAGLQVVPERLRGVQAISRRVDIDKINGGEEQKSPGERLRMNVRASGPYEGPLRPPR